MTEAYGTLACVLFFPSLQSCPKLALQKKSPITQYPGGPLDPVLLTIAHRIGGTPGQVIFKWVHAKGLVIVTTTAKRSRLKEYLDVVHLRASPFSFTPVDLVLPLLADLTPEEVEAIDKAGAQGPPTPVQAGVRVVALVWLSCARNTIVRAALIAIAMLTIIMLLCHCFGW